MQQNIREEKMLNKKNLSVKKKKQTDEGGKTNRLRIKENGRVFFELQLIISK